MLVQGYFRSFSPAIVYENLSCLKDSIDTQMLKNQRYYQSQQYTH